VLLESNGSQVKSFIRGGGKSGIISSNAKDEARSQHKHLHDFRNKKNAIIDLGGSSGN
jgi:hypothetical protein